MSAWERWSLHLAALITALSGLTYGWTRYFGQHLGEFGPEPHPLQGLFQHAHVLAGPVLLFLLGMTLKGHAFPAVSVGKTKGRKAGLGLIAILAPMVLSGYALQVCVDPRWRTAFAWIHGPLALLFLLAYFAHLFTTRRRALRTRPAEVMMEFRTHP
ncbi:MAG: hypothetical protein IPN59_16440 [Holophaga sp.]|nr:hypothetical protein [Holophaga sp.]